MTFFFFQFQKFVLDLFVQGVYVLGGICPGGKCPGGKCPGGKCPGGKCPGGYIIIYLCTETQHYCLLTGGAVKIKSGPLWF